MFAAASLMAEQRDRWTIYYGDDELYSETNPDGWNPNGTVPPQPEADYYLDLVNKNNIYYRFEPVTGSNPVYYEANISVLSGDFKIYAKEFWSERGTSGYGNGDKYIYGASDNNTNGTGVVQGESKYLTNPGQNMQLQGGGTIYGCLATFYPTGKTGNGTPELVLTGGSKVEQTLAITASASMSGDDEATVSFTITANGVVKPNEQTYDVTISYVPDGETEADVRSIQVTGLTGKFTNLAGISEDPATVFTVTAEIKNAPVYSDPSTPDDISGYKDLSATTTTFIRALGDIYLVGNIEEYNWDPEKAIAGRKVKDVFPDWDFGSNVYVWTDVKLYDQYRFRFTSRQAKWTSLNADGTQYYPSSYTQMCENFLEDTSNWYDATVGKETNNAWAPNAATARGTGKPVYYYIFYDLDNNKAAVGWSFLTGVDELGAEAAEGPVDVYTTLGTLVRKNADRAAAVDGLPSGIYIVGGRKVMVR